MENYKIIIDEDRLKNFIEWLPEHKINEQYYWCLMARRKYSTSTPWIKSDKQQLKRGTSTKERLFDKIAQLECKLGAYKSNDIEIPQEALALYISVNPRDLYKATLRSIGHLAKIIECNGQNSNPHQEVLSEIQKTTGTKKYIIFDIDDKDETVLNTCIDIVSGNLDVIETRGGYHLFVHKDKIDKIEDKQWYKKIAAYSDQINDIMTPVVGCTQGNFMPKIIMKNGFYI